MPTQQYQQQTWRHSMAAYTGIIGSHWRLSLLSLRGLLLQCCSLGCLAAGVLSCGGGRHDELAQRQSASETWQLLRQTLSKVALRPSPKLRMTLAAPRLRSGAGWCTGEKRWRVRLARKKPLHRLADILLLVLALGLSRQIAWDSTVFDSTLGFPGEGPRRAEVDDAYRFLRAERSMPAA